MGPGIKSDHDWMEDSNISFGGELVHRTNF